VGRYQFARHGEEGACSTQKNGGLPSETKGRKKGTRLRMRGKNERRITRAREVRENHTGKPGSSGMVNSKSLPRALWVLSLLVGREIMRGKKRFQCEGGRGDTGVGAEYPPTRPRLIHKSGERGVGQKARGSSVKESPVREGH